MMPNVSVVEITAASVIGVLILVNLTARLDKRENGYLWPVLSFIVACAVVIITMIIISAQTQIPWVKVYYWRYSYLGPLPVIIPFVYGWASTHWGWLAITCLILALLLFWLLGWLLDALFVVVGIVIGVLCLIDYLGERPGQAMAEV